VMPSSFSLVCVQIGVLELLKLHDGVVREVGFTPGG
jgi:hypothetical protein